MSENLLTVTIDDIESKVPKGTTILNAARQIGGEITPPAMCYYNSLKGSGGKCRTCMVKVSKINKDTDKGMPKLVVSCNTEVQDGMVVQNITSKEVLDARKGVVELLLINHPLDCPVCDQAGECDLQDLSYQHGLRSKRYEFERRVFEPADIGDKIKLHMNRCILCYRCVYVADQITNGRTHGVVGRGDRSEISAYIKKTIDNDFSGNMIDVCPVGALTDKTYRFKNRVWYTKPVLAERKCAKCCGKVHLWFKGNEIIRATARKNEFKEVEAFICDTCRFEKKKASDWKIIQPAFVNNKSVINSNHYQQLEPPPAIKESASLKAFNQHLLEKEKR